MQVKYETTNVPITITIDKKLADFLSRFIGGHSLIDVEKVVNASLVDEASPNFTVVDIGALANENERLYFMIRDLLDKD